MLTSKQRAYLRGIANSIDTILMVGKGSITDQVVKQAEVALYAREIIIDKLKQAVSLDSPKSFFEDLNNEIVSLSASNSGSNANIDTQKVNLLKLEKNITDLQEQLLSLTKKEEKLNGDKKILQERSKYDATDNRVH